MVGRGARLAKAEQLGHEPVDFTEGDPVDAVRERTAGRGADAVLECSGAAAAVPQSLAMLRRGGRVAVVGIPQDDAAIPVKLLVLDELDLVGVRAAAGEMPEAIALAAAGRLRLWELITHRFSLEDFDEAYRVFTERVDGALKVIVSP